MLDQYHLYDHHRVCSVPSHAMAIVRTQPLIQPVIVHYLFYFPQQVILWYKLIYIHYYHISPVIFFPHYTK